MVVVCDLLFPRLSSSADWFWLRMRTTTTNTQKGPRGSWRRRSLCRGERRWVFPYQENADAMFNSALAYELAVLKPYVEPLLRHVDPGTLAYVESRRWLSFLQWFLPCASDLVPDNSILREFVGGSILRDFYISLGKV